MLAPLLSPTGPRPESEELLLRRGFYVDVYQVGTTAVLRLEGELDTATSTDLRAALAAAMALDAAGIVFDLAGLSFIDSSGIDVLVAARRQAEFQGRSFRLRHAGRMVQKVLHLTGVDRLLTVEAPEACTS